MALLLLMSCIKSNKTISHLLLLLNHKANKSQIPTNTLPILAMTAMCGKKYDVLCTTKLKSYQYETSNQCQRQNRQ